MNPGYKPKEPHHSENHWNTYEKRPQSPKNMQRGKSQKKIRREDREMMIPFSESLPTEKRNPFLQTKKMKE